ncbi:hypothetical protein G7Y89_g3874 [Cudoniella acicularis]|uniref:Uncharacterized protein n=1 Tax=Cudoniella acicularis TaxID=354080 RepID=A0A8H4RQJ0_9HELO|nr:hypothetical protein G7Y89_g3874 [Cudoniella acicularis]
MASSSCPSLDGLNPANYNQDACVIVGAPINSTYETALVTCCGSGTPLYNGTLAQGCPYDFCVVTGDDNKSSWEQCMSNTLALAQVPDLTLVDYGCFNGTGSNSTSSSPSGSATATTTATGSGASTTATGSSAPKSNVTSATGSPSPSATAKSKASSSRSVSIGSVVVVGFLFAGLLL